MTLVATMRSNAINRDIELVRVVLKSGSFVCGKAACARDRFSRHALNRRHVDEGMAQLWRGEILIWQKPWIKRGIVSEIFALKTLAVHFVLLRDLLPFGVLKH